jgi:hypothetical protein
MLSVHPRVKIGTAVIIFSMAACGGRNTSPPAKVSGEPRSPGTAVLETGANALQDITPLKQIGVYLVGFHPMKDNPSLQMEAHHYCNQVNEDFAQCVLFDGNTKEANMTGIEYIISEKLFKTLPEGEHKYWHPHNYEILGGQLVAPGLPAIAEKELMRRKLNSYGKTWHVWMTESGEHAGDKLPLGDAHLAWSFNHDGETNPKLVEKRDSTMKIDTSDKRKNRQDLIPAAHPQSGVEDLAGKFGSAVRPITGVRDERAGARQE